VGDAYTGCRPRFLSFFKISTARHGFVPPPDFNPHLRHCTAALVGVPVAGRVHGRGTSAPMRKRAEWHRLELGPKRPRIVRNTTCIAFKSVYRLNPNCLLGASAGFDPHTCVMIEPPIVLQVCILNSSKVRALLFAPAMVIIYRST
jgi:hypothetical protein